YVVVTIRKIRMTSSTSIMGMKLISGSSLVRPARRFMVWGSPASVAFAVCEFDQLGRLLFHLQRQAIDFGTEIAIEDHARYRHDQAERRVVERDRDAVRELDRIRTRRGLRAEDLDHADHGAEQAEQRRHRRDRAQRRKEAFKVVRHEVSDFFYRLLHDRPWALQIG